MKLKKGDQVKIISGKERGKSVFPEASRITVEGINLYKKRIRPKQQGQKGETVLVARPFAASNAMIVCSNCKKQTRVGFKAEGNQKMRICKKCGAKI